MPNRSIVPKISVVLLGLALLAHAAKAGAATPPKKPRAVGLGAARQVPYSKTGDPAGADPEEKTLRTRPLMVDGRVSEWTTGDPHDVTDRSFVVRRALRINDTLPSDAKAANHWIWQRGPWLLVDRMTGRVTALKLPDYDPSASHVAWFRDYAAYCGVTPTGKSLFGVVAQIGLRKPVLAKKLGAYDAETRASQTGQAGQSGQQELTGRACGLPEWQRDPLRISFHPTGKAAVDFDLVGGSAVLVEGDDEPEVPAKAGAVPPG